MVAIPFEADGIKFGEMIHPESFFEDQNLYKHITKWMASNQALHHGRETLTKEDFRGFTKTNQVKIEMGRVDESVLNFDEDEITQAFDHEDTSDSDLEDDIIEHLMGN